MEGRGKVVSFCLSGFIKPRTTVLSLSLAREEKNFFVCFVVLEELEGLFVVAVPSCSEWEGGKMGVFLFDAVVE